MYNLRLPLQRGKSVHSLLHAKGAARATAARRLVGWFTIIHNLSEYEVGGSCKLRDYHNADSQPIGKQAVGSVSVDPT